jgi:hypothetical protein
VNQSGARATAQAFGGVGVSPCWRAVGHSVATARLQVADRRGPHLKGTGLHVRTWVDRTLEDRRQVRSLTPTGFLCAST